MKQAHYFHSPVAVFDGNSLKIAMQQALVSRQGIFKVSGETAEMNRAFLTGKIFRVALDNSEYRGRLVRESGPDGAHYNLRLIDSEGEQEKKLQELLKQSGFDSPWKRDFARIPSSTFSKQVEVPIGAIISRFTGPASADVRNFSYYGLFVEMQCAFPSLGEGVGQQVRFQLVTSKGTVLDWATGRIARIYDEVVAPGRLMRGMGIRLLELSDASSQFYDGMILDACKEIQRGFNGEG